MMFAVNCNSEAVHLVVGGHGECGIFTKKEQNDPLITHPHCFVNGLEVNLIVNDIDALNLAVSQDFLNYNHVLASDGFE